MNALRLHRPTTGSASTASAWMKALSALALALALTATPSVVRADPEPEVSEPEPEVSAEQLRWNRLISVELAAAVDGPYGIIGGTLVIAPTTNFGLELGGGASRDGGRVTGGARFMFPQDHFALVLRTGVSGGPITWDGPGAPIAGQDPSISPVFGPDSRRRWDFAAFLYADVGLQYRFDMGLYLMLNAGVEVGLIGTADSCRTVDGASACSTGGGTPSRVYASLSIGYAFDIQQP